MKKNFLKILYKRLLNVVFHPFFSINVKPQPLILKENDKCLILAPHPDDESIGCAGIMAMQPDKFKVVCLTHGNDNRRNEFENAMKVLSVENEILDIKDKHINDDYEAFEKIEFSGFNYIFIPYIYDQHSDHKAISAHLNKYLKTHKTGDLKIVFYEVWSTMNMPNTFVDITGVVDKKREAINCHQSQVNEKDYTTKILGLNEYRGMLNNIGFAEAFTVLDKKDFQKFIQSF